MSKLLRQIGHRPFNILLSRAWESDVSIRQTTSHLLFDSFADRAVHQEATPTQITAVEERKKERPCSLSGSNEDEARGLEHRIASYHPKQVHLSTTPVGEWVGAYERLANPEINEKRWNTRSWWSYLYRTASERASESVGRVGYGEKVRIESDATDCRSEFREGAVLRLVKFLLLRIQYNGITQKAGKWDGDR